MTRTENIAAERLLHNLPDKMILPAMRLSYLIKNNIFIYRKKNRLCVCNDKETHDVKSSLILPIFPVINNNLRKYNSFPFVYVCWNNSSKIFPILEIIEIPIFDKEYRFFNIEIEELELKIKPFFSSVVISNSPLIPENFYADISKIRSSIIKSVTKLYNLTSQVYFSNFKNLPNLLLDETEVRFQNDIENDAFWEFQSHREMPIRSTSGFVNHTLQCWAISEQFFKTTEVTLKKKEM